MKAVLALEDGTFFSGQSFTGQGEASGEVIFNTGMTGYQEILTDPSYYGQMVCMTYPLIGNYGINQEDLESSNIHCPALIVRECCKIPSNWRATESLPDYLTRQSIMGLEGIDTRALTKHLRLHGAMRGIISTEHSDIQELVARAKALPGMEGADLVSAVAPRSPYIWKENGPCAATLDKNGLPRWPENTQPGMRRVLVYDFGIKWNILRLLTEQNLNILVVPPDFSAAAVRELAPEGIFLSNGPGDPAALPEAITTFQEIYAHYPIAGICLGHQLLGLALGGKSFKLKFGHHGINHPVRDELSGIIEISSQNHGFCIDISENHDLEITHTNLNDQTLEGFRHKTLPLFSVQHHPESAPGPHDSRSVFSRFRRLVDTKCPQ